MLVNDICRLPNTGASKLSKFLISNWSRGLVMFVYEKFVIFLLKLRFLLKYLFYFAYVNLQAKKLQ